MRTDDSCLLYPGGQVTAGAVASTAGELHDEDMEILVMIPLQATKLTWKDEKTPVDDE